MLLAIETASTACSIALLDRGELVAERHQLVGRGHAEHLLPMVEELLGGRRPSSLIVDCGPGSFTGVRIGIAAALGLAIGWGIPLSGYSSLALLAATVHERDIAAALQGGHGQLFVQSFQREPLAPDGALQSLLPAQAASLISAATVVGNGAAALIDARGYGTAVDADLRAADVRLLPEALRMLEARPIYGRGPDAKPMSR